MKSEREVTAMGSAPVFDYPLLFLNPVEAATVDALVDVILPPEEGSPGAREVGVTEYIDRALAGFMRDLRQVYRHGLRGLGALAVERHEGEFVDLSPQDRLRLVEELDSLAQTDPADPLGQFFRIVREHTVQGFFCDPAYGGNRGEAGWRLVGFPGAQWGYTAEQMQPGFESTSIPVVTIRDLYARIGAGR